jgi:GNAT superfamily N-acetyltransferase
MIIRTMHESDLEFAVECVKREGWPSETEHVFRGFLQYDSGGCMIGEEKSRRVGMCVAVAYAECGFLGELIVVSDRRGHGLGRQLLERSIDYLQGRGCRSIYLDGDEQAVPLYERIGFTHVCKSLRFYGHVQGRSHAHVQPMTSAAMDDVARIDREAFRDDRRFFLEYRLRLFPGLCKVIRTGGAISAFCMGQPGHGVVSIGPWFVGDGIERPLDLLEGVAAETGGAKLRIGILESNSRALREVRAMQGLAETDPSWRMVLGPDTGLGASGQLYAIGAASKG